jgi:hypothetical protein
MHDLWVVDSPCYLSEQDVMPDVVEKGSQIEVEDPRAVPQNLMRADGNAGELPGRANAVDFESGKRRRDGYTALFLSRSTCRQRDASLGDRTQRTAEGFFDCLA